MSLRFSLKAHPLAFLRQSLQGEGIVEAMRLAELKPGSRVKVAGLVLVRQRPGSASGVIFATLEDETGVANVIVWPSVFEAHRSIVLKASLLAVRGKLQREGLVIHVVAEELTDMTERLAELKPGPAMTADPARADEVKRPTRDQRPDLRRHPRNVNPLPKSRDFH